MTSSQTITDEMRDTMARDEVARLNSNALSALIQQHKLFIPQRDFDRWRPTIPTSGTVDGFFDLGNMLCVATDGLQAWFILEGRPPHLGHVQCFRWDVPVVRMVPFIKPTGETGFFKSVKDHGAPSALFGLTPKIKKLPLRKRAASKNKKPTRKSILANL